MSSNTLKRISSFLSLQASWQNLWNEARPKSRGTYGIDEVSLNDFSKNAVANLHILSAQLRSGNYHFSELRPHFVEKPNGGVRVICIPTTQDRIVQGALLNFLSEKYTARFSNKISFGFLKGRTVKEALEVGRKKRQKKPWVFKTDIKAFFDRIQRDQLKEKIRRVVREPTLHPLLFEIVDCEIQTPNKYTKKKILSLGIESGRGVRQGMPLSPFFSNIVLEKFDKTVDSTGYSALRYADDLIFFSADEPTCKEIEKFCRRNLKKEGLEIPLLSDPKTKSVIFNPTEPADFLGVAICKSGASYQIKLLPDQIAKIQKAILDLGSIPELLSRKITIGKLGTSLGARKAGYINAYDMCSNIVELENALDHIEQKVLKRLYTEGLGIDLSKLSATAYTFLGLRN
jgi:group II intron reverse transcriptase/maturase